MKENRKMELQLHAEDTKDPTTEIEEKSTEGTTEVLELTKEELEAKLQSEADRRVSEALKTAKGKWEEEYKAKIEKERREAERLATLSAEEKEKALLEQKETEIAERERALQRKELELDTIQILEEEKLPIKFVGMLLGEDAETTQTNIKAFKEAWVEAIESEMKDRIASTGYKRVPGSNSSISLGEKLAEKNKTQTVKHKFW